MAQPPLSSSSPFPCTYTYDVFLSFRGVDTRTGFTGNLYSALSQRGVLTFIDDDALSKGEEITPSLLNAIQKSRTAIVIFSKNYASSTFCLNELVQILECYAQQRMWIWPVFYDVDPSEVRYQTGSYDEAFVKHEQGRFKDDKEKVQKWRLALRKVASLSGSHFKHGGEYEHLFIRKIIDVVSSKLNRLLLHIANYPVGLEVRMKDVQLLMGAEFDNKVNMLGIQGIGGIGKSTIARAIYNLIAYRFDGSCFLANVREKSTRHGLEQIQETMLSELFGERSIKLGDVYQGIPILKERLQRKKILLILDDVDKKEQLEATAGGLDWFGSGSCIVITTRDKHLLDFHGVKKLYEVNEFNDSEALELFRWNAFKNKEVDQGYTEIIKHAIYYASGLPLALEIIGSNLFGKTLDEWKSALEAYERIPNRDVHKILKVSYDGLEEYEKEIFLDIACFFKGCSVRYVTNVLLARGYHPKYGIGVLEKKSLIKTLSSVEFDDGIFVTMHDLIQYMGKEIVRQQSTWAEKRNRLWFYEDVICVLEKNKENDEIEAMMLDIPEDKEVQWNQEVFGKMEKLRMLIKKYGGPSRTFKHLPNSLRVLEWWGYPAASLPSNFHSKNLVILNLSYSSFQWDKPLEKSEVLSQLIFTGCRSIRQIPDVSGCPNLTELCVDDCTNLIEMHDSVGFLDNLRRFSAKGCTKLRIIPCGIKLRSLEYLCLRDCNSLVNLPEILGPMEKLEFVDLEGTALKNLPHSMQNLRGLQRLHLNRCKMLENKALSNIVQMVPTCFPYLETLNLQHSNLTVLPACIEECRFLKTLLLCNCKQLGEIRAFPPSADYISAFNCISLKVDCLTSNKLWSQTIASTTSKFYILPGQRIPEWFDHSSRGNSLSFWFRKKFPAFVVCAVLGVGDGMDCPFSVNFDLNVKINGIERTLLSDFNFIFETDHIFMCNIFTNMMFLDRGRPLSMNKWNYGEVFFVVPPDSCCLESIKWTGVYVNRAFTWMDDIQFTNPYPHKSTRDDSYYSNCDRENQHTFLCESPIQQQLSSFNPMDTREWLSMRPYGEQHLDNVCRNPDSLEFTGTIDIFNDLETNLTETHEEPLVTSIPNTEPMLVKKEKLKKNSNLCRSQVPLHQRAVMGTQQGDHITLGEQLNTNLTKNKQMSAESNAEATLLFDKNQANTYDAHLLLRKDNVQGVPNAEACMNVVESTINEDNMEAFYASLEAETISLSHVQDTQHNNASIMTKHSEETRKALQILQDFVSKKFSLLLHPGRSGLMKDALNHLLRLPTDEGFSLRTKLVILQLSQSYAQWILDYENANFKLESAIGDLSKADRVKDDLEANVKDFKEMDMVEKYLCNQLASLQEQKRELEEKINAVKAEIADNTVQRDTVAKSKREIFHKGRAMKAERDDLRNQMPRLKAEQEWAKITKFNIEAEWSKLGKQFIGSTSSEEWI